MKKPLSKAKRFLKKWLYCSFFHQNEGRCYPLGGKSWHCAKCMPCGILDFEWVEEFLHIDDELPP